MDRSREQTADSQQITPPDRRQIDAAADRIRPYVRRTPLLEVDGAEFGIEGVSLVLKLELFQHTGSFKPRGAFNRVLSAEVPAAGIIAASGGNHAQAVAHIGRLLGIPTEIFVPETAPAIKVARLEASGARIVQVGEFYDAAREASEARAQETGALVVHAYDQPQIVAGAATLGRELAEQAPEIDAVIVAVGGGGLIGGTAAWFRGDVPVIAVEPRACPTLHAALDAGYPIEVDVGGLASDSLAARRIGAIPFAAASQWVARSVLVEDDDIRSAQFMLWDRLRLVAEPGGATALAGLLSGAVSVRPGQRIAVLVCGGNTDPRSLPGLGPDE